MIISNGVVCSQYGRKKQKEKMQGKKDCVLSVKRKKLSDKNGKPQWKTSVASHSLWASSSLNEQVVLGRPKIIIFKTNNAMRSG